ncbi:glycine-rich domain-containing protein [Bordetella avium]|uniref:glycine-rich domain-containing protein n=1 Tax=Bordetella avium TaxID=521 RepID=UPI0013052C56
MQNLDRKRGAFRTSAIKNFLYLSKKYHHRDRRLVPSMEIDEIWHHHILDTKSYFFDSEKIFGTYFHHDPYFGTRGEADQQNLNDAFAFTQKLHVLEFGYRIPAIWGKCRELLA